MEKNHSLALYIAYYLARFDQLALKNLGYRTWDEAFYKIGQILNVKKSSMQNWRDEFDPLFGYRAGWHQRTMSPSRAAVADALELMDELDIRNIVLEILSNANSGDNTNLMALTEIASVDTPPNVIKSVSTLRGVTGLKAEEHFIKLFESDQLPFQGKLVDTRNDGCGFDFKILLPERVSYVEVKGLSGNEGGILLTSKEWDMASKYGDDYYIVLIMNLEITPEFKIIKNPFTSLNPKKQIIRTVQVQWHASSKDLLNHHD